MDFVNSPILKEAADAVHTNRVEQGLFALGDLYFQTENATDDFIRRGFVYAACAIGTGIDTSNVTTGRDKAG